MAPETHTRYRVQRLIRLGEWLERNQSALITAFDAIDDAHDVLIDPDEDMPCSDIVELAGFKMMEPVKSMQQMMMELRNNVPTRHVKMGEDVTIHQPLLYGLKHQYVQDLKQMQVVIPKPQPKDIPTQEEFDKVRSEVDITN